MDQLTALPSEITAGTTVKFKRTPSDHPSNDGWTLTLYIAGATKLTVVGVADGLGGYDFTLTPANTDDLTPPGNYDWFERASKGGEVYDSRTSPTLRSGVVKVLRDVATAADGDFQSFEEKSLAALQASLTASLTDDIQDYQIAGRAVRLIPLDEKYAMMNTFRQSIELRRRKGRIETPVRATLGPAC